MRTMNCRFCGTPLEHSFVDLGAMPLANSYLKEDQLMEKEEFYPLHPYVCRTCYLVQLPEFQTPEQIFGNYACFSSCSESMLEQAKAYTDCSVPQFGLNANSLVVEIAGNAGYILQCFQKRGIPILGIEPARNVAKAAADKGIPTIAEFFGEKTAKRLANEDKCADLIIGNNFIAHVPDLNDFVKGLRIMLKPQGVVTVEFPHLMHLVSENQFDTIYHGHLSYFSFTTAKTIFAAHGLRIFDVEEIAAHGGFLRIYACRAEDLTHDLSERVSNLLGRERDAGIGSTDYYKSFCERVKATKRDILDFMVRAKREGKLIVGYGAPAKASTLLNYCGIRTDFINYIVDHSPHKQGHYLPGTRLPIYKPEKIYETRPDYLLILAWNLFDEVMKQMHSIRDWGGKFLRLIPRVQLCP